ncbi:hypothetical protein TMSFP064_16630 [Staphylococcus argenteus]|nr:hypothetical protein TMSFP064_16630 [Staphylococcus argenteus]
MIMFDSLNVKFAKMMNIRCKVFELEYNCDLLDRHFIELRVII